VFGANGLRVLTASEDLTARIWDAMSGKPIATIEGRWAEFDKAVETAEFSSDGQRIVSAHAGVGAAIWDAGTGRNFVVITGDVMGAAFSPEGRRVVTTDGKNARIHDATTGRLNIVLTGHEDRVTRVAFSADGHRVVTASQDKTARVWRVFPNTDDLVEEAKRAIPRCLTRVEREEAFLNRIPPAYCAELEKWPYQSQAWKDWLKYTRENLDPPLPDTPEWEAWLAGRKAN
jgi:WD40 repeat protein